MQEEGKKKTSRVFGERAKSIVFVEAAEGRARPGVVFVNTNRATSQRMNSLYN